MADCGTYTDYLVGSDAGPYAASTDNYATVSLVRRHRISNKLCEIGEVIFWIIRVCTNVNHVIAPRLHQGD
jgi:hypothetical protein